MPSGIRSQNGIPLFDVPAGRRAVIEQMSARCDVAPGNPVLELFVEVSLNAHEGNAGTLRFQIPVLSQGTRVAPDVEFFVGSLATRVYADRRDADGAGVTGGAARASHVGSGDCEIQISGHTIAL